MGALGFLGSTLLDVVLRIGMVILVVMLFVYIVGEILCKTLGAVPLVGGPAASGIIRGLALVPGLNWVLSKTSCWDDLLDLVQTDSDELGEMGRHAGIDGDGAGDDVNYGGVPGLFDDDDNNLDSMDDVAHTLMSPLSNLPGYLDLMGVMFEHVTQNPCFILASQLRYLLRFAAGTDFDHVMTEEQRAAAMCLARSWLTGETPLSSCSLDVTDDNGDSDDEFVNENCAGPEETVDLNEYGSVGDWFVTTFGDAAGELSHVGLCDLVRHYRAMADENNVLGTPKAQLIEDFDVAFCGGKYAGRACDTCGDDVLCIDNWSCRQRLPTEGSCTESGRALAAGVPNDADAPRCRPDFDCGSGLAVGVGAKRCAAGSYCRHEPTQTVGHCTPLPADLLDCSDGSGCSQADLGIGWDCISGTCTQNCGPLGLPGTNKSKCLCRPATDAELAANGGVNPYGSGPGYECVMLSAVDIDHPDYQALSEIYGTEIPLFGRAIVPTDIATISGRLLMSDSGYIHVVKFGVKYWVDSAKLPAALRHPSGSDSHGQLTSWSSYSSNGHPSTTAGKVFTDWSEVIRRLDDDVPYPDGSFSSRTDWEVTEVYPDFYELVPYSIAEALDTPHYKRSDDELAARVATLSKAASWSALADYPTVTWNRNTSAGDAYESLQDLALPQCELGEVVTGIRFNGIDSGGHVEVVGDALARAVIDGRHKGAKIAIQCRLPPGDGPGVFRHTSNIPVYGARGSGSGYGSSTAYHTADGRDRRGPTYPRMRSLGLARLDGVQKFTHRIPVGKRYGIITRDTPDDPWMPSPLWDTAADTKTMTIQLGEYGEMPLRATAASMTAECPDGWAIHELGSDHTGKITVKCSDLRA